jgi:hypothetical protein
VAIRIRSFILVFLAALALGLPAVAEARDWFVRAGAEGGDGTRDKPFADPWQALEKCEAGDAVHVTGGKYYGKLGEATWVIPFDKVQLIGGYSADFSARDPWANRSELKWDESSKNMPRGPRLSSQAHDVVVDGFVIDQKDSNAYDSPDKTNKKEIRSENAMNFTQPATVRNSVIVNPGMYGVRAPPGSTIENNLILNAIDWGVSIYTNTGDFARKTATVKNNTILFSWCLKSPGQGRYSGAAVQVNGPANITGNILAHNDNNAIYQTFPTEKVSITRNVFHMNLFSNYKFFLEGQDIAIDNASMADLEEVGLKAYEGNKVADPGLALDPAWLNLYSQRTAYVPGKVTMDDWNTARQILGLPIMAEGGQAATGIAPAYDLDKAMALLEPKNAAVKAGARRIPLTVALAAEGAAAAPAKEYAKAALPDWAKSPGTVKGQALEMQVGIGGVANVSGMPAEYDKERIAGYWLYDAEGQGQRVTGFFMKGTNVERVSNAASGYYDGSGKPPTVFTVRGVAHEVAGVPKAAFFIESIEKYEPAAATASVARPQGRDWFVRAGEAGGDGSREAPFKDPWQALERAESGDTIHVAGGEYFGKLKIGRWKLDMAYVALIGGYDANFSTRNPWKNPTLLYTPPDFKGSRGGYTIEGLFDHTGAIIDGFVFDKRPNNVYKANGDLDYDNSDKVEHLWLNSPGVVVRNSVFVNGAGGVMRATNGQTIENNIFLNHWMKAVLLGKGHTTTPAVVRNNTFAFSWDIKFGQGHGRNGWLLRAETDARAVIDSNIFAFADNDAIQLALEPAEIEITNNVFSNNLWSAVQKMIGNLVVDGSNFAQLGDLGLKKATGNVLLNAGLPVDEAFFTAYLNRTAYVPGKVTMDDWNQVREILGQPLIATGAQGPSGMMPLYPLANALAFFPRNPEVKAGARASDLEVKFEGIERVSETHEYAESSWEAAKGEDSWNALADKRVALTVSIKGLSTSYPLADIKAEEYRAFEVSGPEGIDSGGLPMRCFLKKGTRFERVLNNAKDAGNAPRPEETYVIRGIARTGRQMLVEELERAE